MSMMSTTSTTRLIDECGVFVYWMMLEFHFNFLIYSFNNYIVIMSAVAAVGAVGAAVGAAVENEDYRRLYVEKFPDTVFLDPHKICSCFEINAVWKLSEEASEYDVQHVVASLQFHSMLLLSPTLDTTRPDVYRANLEYEDVATGNVTRITSTDLVPQHAYYYLVMKIYELFLHPAASESIFNQHIEHIAEFITQELNSGLDDGRAFFEDKVRRFLSSHSDFLKHTNPEELQTSINAIWDLLRTDKFKNAESTVQKGFISTIALDDVDRYELAGQGRVTPAAEEAFKKTVYGFHVLVYVPGGHVISMSLSREDLFPDSSSDKVFSFFNSDMIKYMASPDFMRVVNDSIEIYNHRTNSHVPLLQVAKSHHLIFVECGCKSPVLVDGSTRTLTTDTKLPGRREHIVGNSGDGHYIFVDKFPSRDSMNATLVVTSSEKFTGLPNFCEYANTEAVHRMLGIEYGDDGGDSMGALFGDSPLRMHGSQEQEEHSRIVQAALVHASNGAPNVVVPEKAEDVASSKEEMDERVDGAAADPAGTPSNPGMSSGRFFGKVMSGLGTACNFIRRIFFSSTPTCSAEDSVNIEYRKRAMFYVPTQEEDKTDIPIKKKSMTALMTKLPWLEARALWLGVGEVSADLGGGRRPVSRKYRNNKKNISRKKGKKRMSLRHRRSRRRSRSRCLK